MSQLVPTNSPLKKLCIRDGYILLTSEQKIPFSKKEFFEHFARTGLTGVRVVLTAEDISICSPFETYNGTVTVPYRFILTRGVTEFQLEFTEKGHIEREYELRKYGLEGIAEETEDLEWFSSYFSSDAVVTNKLYLDGYRVYHEEISRKDAYENLLASGDKGFIIVKLELGAELRIYNVSPNHSRCAIYIVAVTDDRVLEYVHKTIKCPEGLYRTKNLVLSFPSLVDFQGSDLVEEFQEKAFGMYTMVNGCLPYK